MRRWLLITLTTLVGAPALGLLFFVTFQPIKVLPRMQVAPGFVFTDQAGQTLTSEDLRGVIVLYAFSYTRCAADCPAGLLAEVQTQLAQDDPGVPVRLVWVSVDPERDTPAALAAYGRQAGADFTRWALVTGEAGRLRSVVLNGFDVAYQPRADGAFTLDTRLWLVDGWGLKRAEYAMYLPAAARVMRDIRLVAAEARGSDGVARYAYEAAHLFGCYSQ